MKLEISADVFESARVDALISLLMLLLQGRHDWIVTDDSYDAASEKLPHLLPAVAPTLLLVAEKSLKENLSLNGQAVEVITASNVVEAVRDLELPAVLILEDAVNDAKFVMALAKIYGDTRLLQSWSSGALAVRHGGGARMKQVAVIEANAFRRIIRVVGVSDSDKMYDEHETHWHADQEYLHDIGVRLHVLRFREAENYVPNKALWEGRSALRLRASDLTKKIASLKRLSHLQRRYYDMKHGFKRVENVVQVDSQHGQLFSDLTPVEVFDLAGGFGAGVLAVLAEAQDNLTPYDFDADADREIVEILKTINEVI